MADEQNYDLEPLLTNQQNQLSLVFSDSDSIDSKALAILAANIAVIIFIRQTVSHVAPWQYLALYGPFSVSLLLNFFSIWPREYRGPGIDPKLTKLYLDMEREELLLQLFSNVQAAIAYNRKLNQQRLRACFISILLTGLGFVTLLFIL